MAYTPVNWTNTPTTPLDADNLNHVESGVVANELAAKKANESAVCFSEALGKHTHTKNIYTAANWSLYNGITMTPHSDGGYVSFNGTANTSSQTFLLSLDKSIKLDANKATFVLAKIRLRAVGADVTVSFRDDAFFNSTNVIATNSQTITGTWITDKLTDGEWRTIWAVTGGDKTITKLGVQPLPTTSDYELQVSSIDCYYSGDGAEVADVIARLAAAEGNITAVAKKVTANEENISSLQNSVKANADNVTNLQTTTSANTANISDLQATVNGSASTSGTVKNQIATAKTEIIEGNINPLAERVTAAENNISVNTTNITANTAAISDLRAYVGYTNDDILGLQVDFENKRFTRLAGAVNLTAGSDFDKFDMFGGRKRCNVLDDGTITAYFGDENYTENGSNGQVMVYQPKFYYKVVPLKLDKNTDSGIGYHIRKANYYVSATLHAGFKLHPAFFDSNGNEIDYILYSAYEGCLYSNHHYVDDNSEKTAEIDLTSDVISSLAGRKPISGLYKPMTRANLETLCKNRGTGWHLETIKSVAANQLLMIVEYATMNLQGAIGQGVVSISDNSSYNCSSFTGSTSALGNTTGEAAETVNEINGTKTTYTTSGKTAVSYRGIENPWGNMWRFVNGINVYGDGTMAGGQACISGGFDFSDAVTENYKKSGFTLPTASGYTNALGYSRDDFDWLLLSSEIGGTSALPVGDFTWVAANLNDTRTLQIGGGWKIGAQAGPFCCRANYTATNATREYGGRLLYVPTARI